VQAALEASFARAQGTVEMRTIAGAGWNETVETILEFEPEIFHFSGHGEVVKGSGRLVFTKRATKRSEPVPVRQFCTTLQQRGIRLVVLTSCNTSSGDFKKDFAVIAESLVKSGIPAVVANQLPVPDETAASFVRALYLELVRSGNIDKAVAAGRVTLYGTINVEDDEAAALEWGIPTLHRHPNGAQIFKVG
jgi:CHAT domain-containing protein